MEPKARLEGIYRRLLGEISGERIVRHALRLEVSRLHLPTETLDLAAYARVFVCGAGKASVSMATGVLAVLENRCDGGLVVTKQGDGNRLFGVRVMEAAHPVPDETSLAAGRAMLNFAARVRSEDLVLFCLSGGASALIESLRPKWTLDRLQMLTSEMLADGSDIARINAVRVHTSLLKGGGLARAFSAATVRVLVLSDVGGDQLDVIGSAPFYQGPVFPPHSVLANNAAALRRLPSARLDPSFHTGEARELARRFVAQMDAPGLYAWGGEPTVTIKGSGLGGRCQELALAAAVELRGRSNVAFLAGSTDGTDGPTDVAGAVVDGTTACDDAEAYLKNNDSGGYFARYGGAIRTGPTGSNLNDIFLGWVGPEPS